MTPQAIIQQAAADGVRLVMTPAGTIKARGESEAVEKWIPVLKANKPGILVALELYRLVGQVAKFHGFSDSERKEALEIALSDAKNALISFRALVNEIPATLKH